MLHQQSIQQSCRMVRTKNQASSQMSLKDLARIHDVDTEVEPKEQETHLVVYTGPNFWRINHNSWAVKKRGKTSKFAL